MVSYLCLILSGNVNVSERVFWCGLADGDGRWGTGIELAEESFLFKLESVRTRQINGLRQNQIAPGMTNDQARNIQAMPRTRMIRILRR
jgi:hypothetical protein